jgi:hypothetical protein
VRLERVGAILPARLPWHLEEPDLSAVLSADGRVLRLYGVNSTDQPITVKTALTGFAAGVVKGEVHVLKDSQGGHTPEVLNTRDEPQRLQVFHRPARVRGRGFDLAFEPFSLTLCELELGGNGAR